MFAGSFCPNPIQIFAGENFICNCSSFASRSLRAGGKMQRRLLCLAAARSVRLLMPKQNNVAFEPFARAGGVQVTSTKFLSTPSSLIGMLSPLCLPLAIASPNCGCSMYLLAHGLCMPRRHWEPVFRCGTTAANNCTLSHYKKLAPRGP